MSESNNTAEYVETQKLRKWRSLTEPPMICDDRVRKVYDATTGKSFPVQWEPVVASQQEVGIDNL